jgi:putative oxidoreductase
LTPTAPIGEPLIVPAFLSRYGDQAYALLRIVAGFLFLWHGAQKLVGFPVPPGGEMAFHIQFIAGPIELVGGSLVALGLFTRWSAFLCSGQMAVAYWTFHAPRALFPLENRGELAALYCFVFLLIAARGPGIWSLDRARGAA